jgi:hypothetical protein
LRHLDTAMTEDFNPSSPDLRSVPAARSQRPRRRLVACSAGLGSARPGLGGAGDPGSQWALLARHRRAAPTAQPAAAGKSTLTSVLVTVGITSTTKSAYWGVGQSSEHVSRMLRDDESYPRNVIIARGVNRRGVIHAD